ncbi:MAG TPA: indole-3-glycerol-phosphate synthase [Steroidobacteraceae bacterium]|jgi:indole-3-glycerol phosphate synthase|nr:indole-3-glycerol-phosphate synthase [Steroidobacteraceae bacterium]
MSEDFLATMAASSQARADAAREQASDAALLARALATPVPPRLQLSPRGFDIIAEVKLRSPAAGLLNTGTEDVAGRVVDYAAAGAAAVSVLTEPSRFDGALAHLDLASRALANRGSVPAMRKDFLVDPYQLCEARVAGAGGVLLILRMLKRDATQALLEMAARLQLFVLVETFDEADIDIAQQIAASPFAQDVQLLVGLNSRDLVTLKVVPGRLEQLVARLPGSLPRVAESGVGSGDDAARLAAAGYDMALVGSALMTAADPSGLLREMLERGREAR